MEGLLAKDVAQRYPSVDGTLGDLRALRNETLTTTVRTQPGPRKKLRPWAWAAALGAVAAIAAGGLYLSGTGRAPGAPAAGSFDRLTSQEGSESFPSLSPDGKYLLYVKEVNGNADVYLQRVGGGNPLNLTKDSPEDDTQAVFSPDGQQIAFRSEREGGGLFLMGATGESVRRLTDVGYNPAWSPDGREIAFATEGVEGPLVRKLASQLGIVDVAAGTRRLIARDDAVEPSWSPNGHRIAYWGIPKGSARRVIWTIPAIPADIAGAAQGPGEPVQVTGDSHVNWNPVWAPDGKGLYFVSDRSGSMNVWWVPIDEVTGRVLGEPQAVTTSSQSLGLLSVSHDGRQIVYATDDGKSNLERRSLDPSALRVSGEAFPVTQGSQAVRSAAVSPDGQWIAFDSSSPQEDLYVVRPDGTGLRQLTDDVAKDRIPRWLAGSAGAAGGTSGTGNDRIVFYSDRTGSRYGAWTIRADGSALQPLPHGTSDALYNPIGSPDGRWLVASLGFQSAALLDLQGGGKPLVELLPPSGGGREVFSATSWSPDGTRLAGTLAHLDGSEIPGVVLFSRATRSYERLTDSGTIPVWLHGGPSLLYLREGRIFLYDLDAREPRLLSQPPANSIYTSLAVSPDDRTLYTVRSTDEGDVWMVTLKGEGDSR